MRRSANASITLTNSVGLSPPQSEPSFVVGSFLQNPPYRRKSALQFGIKFPLQNLITLAFAQRLVEKW
ncbi:hypothetical protein [Nostoc sp.]|uniref:hypothetical protein n=1 Tax=Nostoc sp. TaxID=1180 RepID=UPI002FF95D9B